MEFSESDLRNYKLTFVEDRPGSKFTIRQYAVCYWERESMNSKPYRAYKLIWADTPEMAKQKSRLWYELIFDVRLVDIYKPNDEKES